MWHQIRAQCGLICSCVFIFQSPQGLQNPCLEFGPIGFCSEAEGQRFSAKKAQMLRRTSRIDKHASPSPHKCLFAANHVNKSFDRPKSHFKNPRTPKPKAKHQVMCCLKIIDYHPLFWHQVMQCLVLTWKPMFQSKGFLKCTTCWDLLWQASKHSPWVKTPARGSL